MAETKGTSAMQIDASGPVYESDKDNWLKYIHEEVVKGIILERNVHIYLRKALIRTRAPNTLREKCPPAQLGKFEYKP